MEPCPFVRVLVESLSLKIAVASRPAGPGIHPSATPCYCKIRLKNFSSQTDLIPLDESPSSAHPSAVFQLDPDLLRRMYGKSASLHVSVYTGRMGTSCGLRAGKLLGKVRVQVNLDSEAERRAEVFHSGWVGIGGKGKPSAHLHLVVRSEPDPRFVFQFGGEPECSPVVFQLQGTIRQPVFSCKFSADRNSRSRSLLQDFGSTQTRGWMKLNSLGIERERHGRERKGWMVMIHDLSGSPIAAASMITPFVPSPGSDRVSRSNPGAWLILRPHGFSVSSWKPWARVEVWRERAPADALGYKLELVTNDGSDSGIPLVESTLSIKKGGRFHIDASKGGNSAMVSRPSAGGFVMSSTIEGEGKVSKPTVQVAMKHVTCMSDAAVFVALSAAIDLSMDACRLFSQKLRKELCHDQNDSL